MHSGKKIARSHEYLGPKIVSTCKRQDDLTVRFHDAGLLSYQSRHQPNPQSGWHMCSWLRSTSKRSHCKAALSRHWCCLKKTGWPKCFQNDNHLGTQTPVMHTPVYRRQSFCLYTRPCDQPFARKTTVLLASYHTYTLVSDSFNFFSAQRTWICEIDANIFPWDVVIPVEVQIYTLCLIRLLLHSLRNKHRRNSIVSSQNGWSGRQKMKRKSAPQQCKQHWAASMTYKICSKITLFDSKKKSTTVTVFARISYIYQNTMNMKNCSFAWWI